jgi:fatty-acyl-CoA synthase
MCFTSGTTGRPKGVVYSHRALVLHTLVTLGGDAFGLLGRDVAMPVVPMFHANAWGLPYSASLCGAKMVLPGPHMDPRELGDLIAAEKVTWTAGVPTLWQGMLQLDPPPDLSSLREVTSGGAALPESLARAFDEKFGVPMIQGWGMTETGPLASLSRPPQGLKAGEDYDLRLTQGRVQPLVHMRLDTDNGGEVQVRGPYIASEYYEDPSGSDKFTEDGWLRTGDVAEMHGVFVKLVDRTKDLVKSGGEWISSVELENHIMGHPDVVEAAVIAVPDERWTERPCACVVACEGAQLDADALREHLAPLVAKWWIPERVEFIDEVPKTSVGKFDKKVLRARFAEQPAPAPAEAAAT